MTELISKIVDLAVNPFLGFLFALATVVFIWGVLEFIASSDNEEKRNIGRKHIVWGIVGLVIMFSVWGIYAFIQNFANSF